MTVRAKLRTPLSPLQTRLVTMADQNKSRAALLLMQQMKSLSKSPIEGFSAGLENDDNPFEWNVCIVGSSETLYDGGLFNAKLNFPDTYPEMPPVMKFTTDIWHPNVYPDGRVCISILHNPGHDPMNPQERAEERWLPIHTVETIVLSVISMLADPNDESPANIDAAKEWRDDFPAFKKRVARCVRRSQEFD